MQITTYAPNHTVTTFVAPARDDRELVERIADASASLADIARFRSIVRDEKLSPKQRAGLAYAHARALHREGYSVTLDQLALIANTSTKACLQAMKWLKVKADAYITSDDATRVMFRLMD